MNEIAVGQEIHASQLRLIGDDVLIRTQPAERERASGLVVPHFAQATMGGDTFYGEVVSTGPGRVLPTGGVVPTEWKPGDQVVVRRGFGPEIKGLAEGVHYIVQRGNDVYKVDHEGRKWLVKTHGHGIVCAWEPGHVHCWHEAPLPISDEWLADADTTFETTNQADWDNFMMLVKNEQARRLGQTPASCSCGKTDVIVETCLPSCLDCPPGPRVAEAKVGVETQKIKAGPGPSDFERQAEDERGYRIALTRGDGENSAEAREFGAKIADRLGLKKPA